MAHLIFWISVGFLVYAYFGYPALVALVAQARKREVKKGLYEPPVTVIISAYNEEQHIERTVRNKLVLEYPKDKLEIIVVSDGSVDGTDQIVEKISSENVRLLRQEPRRGKTAALNMAVPLARGEVLVFSDANSMYEPGALTKLMRNFSDPSVGYVTGKMIYQNPDGSGVGEGCSAYMKYENFLRRMETDAGSIIGVDGGIDAVRSFLYQPMNPEQLPDFVLPLKVVEQGYRVVYEPDAILLEPSLQTSEEEYRMRVRVALRALWALRDMSHLLSFRKYTFFAWQLWSHKALRYCCFIFLFFAFFSNLALWNVHHFYRISLILQGISYLVFFLQLMTGITKGRSRILNFIHYFVLLNLASAHAFVKFLLGQKQVMWTPRSG
jgi:cellulose synthase/poly-beta-1,6-N-acetylglucosamine synthase-like glycosyltransferase